MAKIVGLPKLSPTMEEGTLARWHKKEGDEIAVDDLLAEVETDKATMEWRSFDRGVLLKILVPEGSTLRPDTPVAIIGARGEDISSLLASLNEGGPKGAPPVAQLSQEGPSKGVTTAPAPGLTEKAQPSRLLASPLVRRLAREHGLDLRQVQGSGPGGRIIKRDIEALIGKAEAPPAFELPPFERPAPIRKPLSQMRKTIARRLLESKQTIPHFYLTIDVDMGRLLEERAALNAELEARGQDAKTSINDWVVKATALALKEVPECNASFAGNEILYHQVIDISIAVAVPDGLVTPVLRDADRKGIVTISQEIRALAERAREKKLRPEEMQGGTFSISNLGMYGIEEFAAVINPPEAAILAVGSVRDEVVVEKGQILPGKRMKLTLSCDHRVIDGATGARFLAVLKRLLERPILMLIG
ncbi:MAG: pyruvate dehydrogenase complex dihydrolipoamide acetyltransferase [Sandaracinaceae bacterium]|nr:pyruvate dehydrogenase complex dihydrolipoamide acetyltransferase [Sandaracinaceae bacterium]MDW8245578.1 pyruvate dehydrogenase complex dihydrolipoamide acetyltransferase [Sandaracinaceae bacterium]